MRVRMAKRAEEKVYGGFKLSLITVLILESLSCKVLIMRRALMTFGCTCNPTFTYLVLIVMIHDLLLLFLILHCIFSSFINLIPILFSWLIFFNPFAYLIYCHYPSFVLHIPWDTIFSQCFLIRFLLSQSLSVQFLYLYLTFVDLLMQFLKQMILRFDLLMGFSFCCELPQI